MEKTVKAQTKETEPTWTDSPWVNIKSHHKVATAVTDK